MKYIKYVLLLVFLQAFSTDAGSDDNIAGTYYSKRPTLIEKAALMYSRGFFNFLYLEDNDETLELNPDHTFTRTFNVGNAGAVSDTGIWKASGKTVTLDFDTAEYANQSFTIYKANTLYMVTGRDAIGWDETRPQLTLLKKP